MGVQDQDPKSNGHAAVPNEFLDRLAKSPLHASELRIVVALLRETMWEGASKPKPVSFGLLERLTGMDRTTVARAVRRLKELNVVLAHQARGRYGREQHLFLNLDSSSWLTSGAHATSGVAATSGVQVPLLVACTPKPSGVEATTSKNSSKKEKKGEEGPSFQGLTILTKGGDEYRIPLSLISTYQDAYPAVDVAAELRKMAAWSASNPRNRKTDIPRFMNGWLSREQEKARSRKAPAPSGSDAPNPEVLRLIQEHRERKRR